MGNRVKNIQAKLVAFWNKYNSKQKMLIISIAATIAVALTIMYVVLSRPTYVELISADTTKEAAEVKDLLDEEGIDYQISSDGLLIKVNKDSLADATLLLGENSIPAAGYSIDDVFSGGFSSTEADKEKKYKLYLEDKIGNTLEQLNYVSNASVQLTIPTSKLSVLDSDEETSASVMLTLKSELPDGGAESIAKYVAAALGNATTNSIYIMDSDTNMLFAGDTTSTDGTTGASGQTEIKDKANDEMISNVKKLFSSTQLFDVVEVAPHLEISFDQTDTVRHEYDVADGRDEGYLDSQYTYEAQGGSVSGGTPGTDSNDTDTTYEITSSDGSTSTVTVNKNDYVLNETVTTTTGAVGQIQLDQSSISIVSSKYVIYDEDELEAQGLLKGTTFEKFKAAHLDKVPITIDNDMIDMVAKATGIAAENIHITAYEIPFFQASESESRSISGYLQIALAALILGLLGFVVFKSTRPVEVTELEPELSVEALLATTKENVPVEEIDLNDKSETRKAIEKFVDESPEAVALLLRNWLNDGWE